MKEHLFDDYANFIKEASEAELAREVEAPKMLRIHEETSGGKTFTAAYAPFDFVNKEAQVVIVGLTPGKLQMRNALMEARRLLRSDLPPYDVLKGAKVSASFSGPMRRNLVAMLDYIGLANALSLQSSLEVWGLAAGRVHFTSALRYPVFVDGKNYSGSPYIVRNGFLKEQVLRWFAQEMSAIPNAVYVPLGPRVAEAVELAAAANDISPSRILTGLPHPSGANAERIAFFLDRKPENELSNKVSPLKILQNRTTIIEQIEALGVMK